MRHDKVVASPTPGDWVRLRGILAIPETHNPTCPGPGGKEGRSSGRKKPFCPQLHSLDPHLQDDQDETVHQWLSCHDDKMTIKTGWGLDTV